MMSSNDDGYSFVVPGALKLKGGIKKKKSKKNKEKKKTSIEIDENLVEIVKPVKTESELKFEKLQEQKLKDRVEALAKKSHKDKVQEFNQKLEKLSEHYDIPKVGPG